MNSRALTSSESLNLDDSVKKFQVNLLSRIDNGINYCSNLYNHEKKCMRLIRKYNCETCNENELFCKAWRKITELTKQYYISQIIFLIQENNKKLERIPEWARYQRGAKINLNQLNLFNKGGKIK